MEPRDEERGLKPHNERRKSRFRIIKLEERIAPSQLVHVTDPVHLKLKP